MTSTVSLVWLTIALPFIGFLVNGAHRATESPTPRAPCSLVGPGA